VPTSLDRRLAQRARATPRCNVPGCQLTAYRISSRCRTHAKRHDRNGHPTARPISVLELRPYRDQCAALIARQKSRLGIQRAVEWLGALLSAGKALPPWRLHPRTAAADRVSAWMASHAAEGVTPEACLTTVLAMYLIQELEPRRFAGSDHFFRHQLALRVLRLGSGKWHRHEKTHPGTVWQQRVTAATCALLGRQLVSALGPLGLSAARYLSRAAPTPAVLIDGAQASNAHLRTTCATWSP
jgi:hypothetical protein